LGGEHGPKNEPERVGGESQAQKGKDLGKVRPCGFCWQKTKTNAEGKDCREDRELGKAMPCLETPYRRRRLGGREGDRRETGWEEGGHQALGRGPRCTVG